METFGGLDLLGHAVLLPTGWDQHWGTAAYGAGGHPYLTADAASASASALVDAGVSLVGIDSVNIDATTTGERPAHSTLLAAGIPIVEHLRGLDEIPAGRQFTFTAVPVKVAGMGTFPVRAFAAMRSRTKPTDTPVSTTSEGSTEAAKVALDHQRSMAQKSGDVVSSQRVMVSSRRP